MLTVNRFEPGVVQAASTDGENSAAPAASPLRRMNVRRLSSRVTSTERASLAKIGPHRYKGTFVVSLPGGFGDWQTNLESIAVALSANGRWDSNGGDNYAL